MPSKTRNSTAKEGVTFIEALAPGTKKPDRCYYIRYRKDGKQVEEKAGYASCGMTVAKAALLRADRIQGKEPTNEERREEERKERNQWTFDRVFEEWDRTNNLRGRAENARIYRSYIQPVFGNLDPAQLDQLSVRRFRANLEKQKKAKATVKNILAVMRRLVFLARSMGIDVPASIKVEMPKVDNLVTETLNDAQLAALLQAAGEYHEKDVGDIVLLALYSGLRKSEIFKLAWSDVDFDSGFLLIREPKGGVSTKVPMSNSCAAMLNERQRWSCNSEFVFPGKQGGHRVEAKKALYAIYAAANELLKAQRQELIPEDFRPLHGLRHAFASRLASSGQVDLYTLQRLMTHKSPQMTQRYAHLADERLRAAASVTDRVMKAN